MLEGLNQEYEWASMGKFTIWYVLSTRKLVLLCIENLTFLLTWPGPKEFSQWNMWEFNLHV